VMGRALKQVQALPQAESSRLLPADSLDSADASEG